jgi:RNA polymerase sigma-70 factor (ECF subfamily)
MHTIQAISAYESLINVNAAALRHFCLRLTGSHPLAEDLFQETCLRTWQKFDQCPRGASAVSWLRTVARNLFCDRFRRGETKIQGAELTWNSLNDRELLEGIADPAASCPEIRIQIDQAIESLGDHHRAVVEMILGQGLPEHSVARKLGVPVGTVRSRLSRAKKRLREIGAA